MNWNWIAGILYLICTAWPLVARSGAENAAGQPCSPYAGLEFPRRVYWGDTRLHTSNSFDA
jgi:hypothetical protein